MNLGDNTSLAKSCGPVDLADSALGAADALGEKNACNTGQLQYIATSKTTAGGTNLLIDGGMLTHHSQNRDLHVYLALVEGSLRRETHVLHPEEPLVRLQPVKELVQIGERPRQLDR